MWLAGWMIPLGYLLAAAFPLQKKAGLHVVFIGGFALLTLSVGLHVLLAHGGQARLVGGRPWQVPAFATLLALAVVGRAMVDVHPAYFRHWLTLSASAFLLATIFWATLAIPGVWSVLDRNPAPDGHS